MLELPGARPAPNYAAFDFRYAPEVAADPWRYFGGASEGAEIFWSDALGGHWVVARAALIAEVFRRHDLFSNGAVSIPAPPVHNLFLPASIRQNMPNIAA